MTNERFTEPNRFTELLPWYVNGTISAPDRTWFESHLRAHPEAASELRWYQSLRERIVEGVPEVSPEIGMDRAFAKIRGDQRIRAARESMAPTTGDKIRAWFGRIGLSPALAVALAVIAVQAGILVNMNRAMDDQFSEIRALKRSVGVSALRVTFKPDAREEDIRLAIAGVGGSLVAGPGSLGDYYLRTDLQLGSAAAKLQASPAVESVAIVDRLPTKD